MQVDSKYHKISLSLSLSLSYLSLYVVKHGAGRRRSIAEGRRARERTASAGSWTLGGRAASVDLWTLRARHELGSGSGYGSGGGRRASKTTPTSLRRNYTPSWRRHHWNVSRRAASSWRQPMRREEWTWCKGKLFESHRRVDLLGPGGILSRPSKIIQFPPHLLYSKCIHDYYIISFHHFFLHRLCFIISTPIKN